VTILLRQRAISSDQVEECREFLTRSGLHWAAALQALFYASAEQITAARAEALHLRTIDLAETTIPPAIIELVPESVARENVVLPVALEGRCLILASSDPEDFATIEKLQFILNKHIQPVLAPREQIIEAINRHYGQTETECVDSMLAEFTDTAIDFTETERSELAFDKSYGVEFSPAPAQKAPRPVEQRATVRYYERMNPDRLYPLLVVLSRTQIEEIQQRNVSQARSQAFRVETGSVVEIEPILPGCECYPPSAQVTVGAEEARAEFFVAPHVLGRILKARVVVRQEGRTLAEVPLETRVVRQALTWAMAGLSLVLPFVLLLLKQFRLDFETQRDEGFGLYAQIAGWLIQSLTPEILTLILLAATAGLYWWLRPRQRDCFWDVTLTLAVPDQPVKPADTTETLTPDLLALEHGDRRPVVYFRASLAAHRKGDTVQALVILRQAEADLGPEQMTGPMWYNMACFAAMLRQHPTAMRYLQNAVDAGYANVAKIRSDPDLASLRLSGAFKKLLAGLGAGTP
jgi:hypothetical protein